MHVKPHAALTLHEPPPNIMSIPDPNQPQSVSEINPPGTKSFCDEPDKNELVDCLLKVTLLSHWFAASIAHHLSRFHSPNWDCLGLCASKCSRDLASGNFRPSPRLRLHVIDRGTSRIGRSSVQKTQIYLCQYGEWETGTACRACQRHEKFIPTLSVMDISTRAVLRSGHSSQPWPFCLICK